MSVPARRIRKLVAVLLGCGLVSVKLTVWLNLSPSTVLLELTQPATPDYESYGPYSVYVLEGPRNWGALDFPRRHRLVIARAGDSPPTYGHMLDYSFHAMGADMDSHIRQSTAEWTPDGVTFVEASGHRLFVPKRLFVGGR